MTDVTLRIKNLSIALEAISRINNEGSPDLYDRIETCLRREIQAAEEEKKESEHRTTRSVQTDDIPF